MFVKFLIKRATEVVDAFNSNKWQYELINNVFNLSHICEKQTSAQLRTKENIGMNHKGNMTVIDRNNTRVCPLQIEKKLCIQIFSFL